METTMTSRQKLDETASRLKAHAVAIGLACDYDACITWANESISVYLSLPLCRKIRISDHGSAYGCSISVSPGEMSEAEAIAWLDAERADELADEDEVE
jgi:hypothetical protein